MNPTNAENLATINMNVLISHLTHDIYNHALFDFTCHRCYFQVLLYVPQPSQTVLAWFYLKHSWHISFLIKVNCVHVLTSEGLHVREIMSEKSCQRDHVSSWLRLIILDYHAVYKLPDTLDEYVTWLMGYLGMSGILLKLGSFSTYPLFVLTHTHLFWLHMLCLRSPRFVETMVVMF